MNAWWFEGRIQPHRVRFCMYMWPSQVCVCLCLCARMCSHLRATWCTRVPAEESVAWRPAAPLLWENGGCIASLFPFTQTPIHLYPFPFPPSLSERLHSPPYRLKPALTVLAPLTHTLSRGHTTLWNNYSLNWHLINLKSIWPCQANLEFESRDSRDTEVKNWVDGGMGGAEGAERAGGRR